jgi:integrase
MKTTPSRKKKQTETWPREVQPGRAVVRVYRRKTPQGNLAYMVANYAEGKRRFDSYAVETDALDAADRLAKQIDKRDYVAASMTQAQAVEYADAVAALAPFDVTVRAASSAVAECLKMVGDLPNLVAAAKFYTARNKQTVKKRVPDVVAELLSIKESRGASRRYMEDLRYRLNRVADAFQKDACNVTTAEIQEWLDGQKFGPQAYTDFRNRAYLLFQFSVARGYAVDNPVTGVERIKVRGGDVEVFTPAEMTRLMAVASPDFLPCLAIGGFAGLRSAEIERLEWSDIHLAEKFIVVGASKAKTAGRRIVPIADNLAQWLQPYARKQGLIWPGTHDAFYDTQGETAAATAVNADPEKGIKDQKPVKWKSNALRHSYASYRFAQIGDAGRVAGELGNSAAVVHKHYRELVKPADAIKWFNVMPEAPANVLPLAATMN